MIHRADAVLRDFTSLSDGTFDLLIIGGGITGACIAWDASLRGLRVALVEAQDFSHATSAATSKMVHGGLRYLKNLEFSLVRESLRERRIWSRIAPHIVDPLPFLAPTYGYGMQSRLVMGMGLTLYDLLSFDRNRLDDPDKHLPGHAFLNRAKTLDIAPALDPTGLTGAMMYYDCQSYAPERIGLECVLGARDHGATVVNYAKVTEVHRVGNTVTGARVDDLVGGGHTDVKASLVINASGPWADDMAALVGEAAPSVQLIRSKGIHVITRRLVDTYALALFGDGNHFLVLPWRDHTILGTTDTAYDGDPADVRVTEDDIDGLLATVNQGMPGTRLARDDVLSSYAGLRPLVDQSGPNDPDDSYEASRKAELVDHAQTNGFISAVGGKWTTSRHMAERVVDLAVQKLNKKVRDCTTQTVRLRGAPPDPFRAFSDQAVTLYPGWTEPTLRHLARTYGAKLEHVMAEATGAPETLSPHTPDIGAQVTYAVRYEMAQNLCDVVFRRTGLGTLCHPGHDALTQACDVMADDLGWDESEKCNQIRDVETALATAFAREPGAT